MVGDLAQIVSLTSYGNLLLTDGSSSSAKGTLNEHCLSGFVRFMEFLREGIVVADHPSDWILHLSNRNAHRIRMMVFKGGSELPDHIAASFANGIASGLQIDFENNAELWITKSLANADEGWTVILYCVPLPQPISSTSTLPTLQQAGIRLSQALRHSLDYAAENRLSSFSDHFSKIVAMLERNDLPASELLPARGYCYDAHRLIQAADRAWVFGGMGSWNDCADEETLSMLYEAVVNAILSATNSFDREAALQDV
jgi:hypothetical protein